MRFLAPALLGGLVAGALDIAYACIAYFALLKVPPVRIFQSIAAGVVGKEAASAGGAQTALLGGALHFAMTTVMAGFFVAVARANPWLTRAPLVWGAIYGVGLFFVMNYAVVPLSAAHGQPPPMPFYAMGLAAHVLLVGVPIALIAAHFNKESAPQQL